MCDSDCTIQGGILVVHGLSLRKKERKAAAAESFPSDFVVKDVSFSAGNGSVTVLMGLESSKNSALLDILARKWNPTCDYELSGSVNFHKAHKNNGGGNASPCLSPHHIVAIQEQTCLASYFCGLEENGKIGRVGYVTEDSFLDGRLSVLDNLKYRCRFLWKHDSKKKQNERVARVLESTELSSFACHIVGDECRTGLSEYCMLRLRIAMQLLGDPSILLVDEPLSEPLVFTGHSSPQIVKTSPLRQSYALNLLRLLKKIAAPATISLDASADSSCTSGRVVIIATSKPPVSQAMTYIASNTMKIVALDRQGLPFYKGCAGDDLDRFVQRFYKLSEEETAESSMCVGRSSEGNPADYLFELMDMGSSSLQATDKVICEEEPLHDRVKGGDKTALQLDSGLSLSTADTHFHKTDSLGKFYFCKHCHIWILDTFIVFKRTLLSQFKNPWKLLFTLSIHILLGVLLGGCFIYNASLPRDLRTFVTVAEDLVNSGNPWVNSVLFGVEGNGTRPLLNIVSNGTDGHGNNFIFDILEDVGNSFSDAQMAKSGTNDLKLATDYGDVFKTVHTLVRCLHSKFDLPKKGYPPISWNVTEVQKRRTLKNLRKWNLTSNHIRRGGTSFQDPVTVFIDFDRDDTLKVLPLLKHVGRKVGPFVGEDGTWSRHSVTAVGRNDLCLGDCGLKRLFGEASSGVVEKEIEALKPPFTESHTRQNRYLASNPLDDLFTPQIIVGDIVAAIQLVDFIILKSDLTPIKKCLQNTSFIALGFCMLQLPIMAPIMKCTTSLRRLGESTFTDNLQNPRLGVGAKYSKLVSARMLLTSPDDPPPIDSIDRKLKGTILSGIFKITKELTSCGTQLCKTIHDILEDAYNSGMQTFAMVVRMYSINGILYGISALIAFVAYDVVLNSSELHSMIESEQIGLNLYRVSSFITGFSIGSLPYEIIPTLVMAMLVYFMAYLSFSTEQILFYSLMTATCAACSYALGFLVSVTCRKPFVSAFFLSAILLLLTVMGGFFLRETESPIWLFWISLVNPYRWTFLALVMNQFPPGGVYGSFQNSLWFAITGLDTKFYKNKSGKWYCLAIVLLLLLVLKLSGWAILSLKCRSKRKKHRHQE